MLNAESEPANLCGTAGQNARFEAYQFAGYRGEAVRARFGRLERNNPARNIAAKGALRYRDAPSAVFSKRPGHVAEWLRSGLQNRLRRFNSGRGLHLPEAPCCRSPGASDRADAGLTGLPCSLDAAALR